MKRRRSIVALVATYLAVLGLVLGGLVANPAPAGAQANPFERGPAPSDSTLNGRGPFSVSQTEGRGSGFNNGTIYYPNNTSQGTFAAIVVMPGFLSPKILMQWAGPKFASHGFVVMVMEPSTVLDFPGGRANQMQAALRWLTTSSPTAVRSRIDPSRLGAMGHSMGGGASLDVGSRNNPRMEAVVALQPWNIASYGNMSVPTMIIGASNDLIAATAGHSEPFYNSIRNAEKQYVELSGEGHLVGVTDHRQQSKSAIAWFKRYLDNDTRYDRFICPPPSGLGIAETRNTCPA
jgi:predicted dienelactone hydrolase